MVNVDVTAPGATLALGMMFFNTNNTYVTHSLSGDTNLSFVFGWNLYFWHEILYKSVWKCSLFNSSVLREHSYWVPHSFACICQTSVLHCFINMEDILLLLPILWYIHRHSKIGYSPRILIPYLCFTRCRIERSMTVQRRTPTCEICSLLVGQTCAITFLNVILASWIWIRA